MKDEIEKEFSGGLFIGRFPGQRIVINGDTVIRIHEVSGRQVRLQIVAPKEVHVGRPTKEEDAADRARHSIWAAR